MAEPYGRFKKKKSILLLVLNVMFSKWRQYDSDTSNIPQSTYSKSKQTEQIWGKCVPNLVIWGSLFDSKRGRVGLISGRNRNVFKKNDYRII